MCKIASMRIDHPMGAKDVAETLGVDRGTVVRWAQNGRLKAAKLPGLTGSYVFDRTDVEKLRTELLAEKAS
jgi:excisionase family DNA binding protein